MNEVVKSDTKTLHSGGLDVLKGSLYAVAISLVGILLFAFIIKMVGISDAFISPVNQVIKIASILVGCFVCFKHRSSNGLLKGALLGVLYTLLAFIIFSVLNGDFGVGRVVFNDCLFGAIMGAICGIVSVNLKR